MWHSLRKTALAITLITGAIPAAQALSPTALRCEYRSNPLGIDATQPRLYWQLASKQRGAMQSAFQILAASSEASLRGNVGDLWDTGKVTSDRSTHIVYAGKSLHSGQRVWWKVRVWDKNNSASGYSRPAMWEMGKLAREDWKAQWIGYVRPEEKGENLADVKWIWFPEGNPLNEAPGGSRYFRYEFQIPADRGIKEASLLGVADNTFEATVNGKAIGGGSGWQAFQRVSFKDQIRTGKNALCITAGNESGPAGLAAIVKVVYTDGGVDRFVTGSRWKTSQQEASGWKEANYDASSWKDAMEIANMGAAPWNTPKFSGAEASPSAHLRKKFSSEKAVKRARIYASAMGLYQLTLNGRRVSGDIFTPGWTDYRKRIQYQTYDVTRMLQKGENVVGMLLGEGWFSGYVGLTGKHNYGTTPRALVQMEIEYADGSQQQVVSDSTWKAGFGPILSNDLLMGETYDARREVRGWDTPGFDDTKWMTAEAIELTPVPLVASCTEAVQKVIELSSKSLKEKPAGAWVFDLGQNMVGWARLKVQGKAGTTVRLRFAEMLNPDGSIYTTNLRGAKCTDYYTLKGGGTEVYEPTFTFRGFRYVEVTGYPGKPSLSALTGVVVTSVAKMSGTFECSNPMVNKLQSNIVWGQRGNYLEVPTDCPQRDERLGWMGDAQVFIRTACFNMDVAAFMTKWMQDVEDAQSPQGGFPDVAPRIGAMADGAPAWGDAGVIVPWNLYLCYGDTHILEKHYAAMAKWIAFIDSANPNHLWVQRSGNNYGDWLNIKADMPRDVLGTSYFAHSTQLLAKTARILGKNEDAEKYETLFREIKAAYNAAYVRSDGFIKGDTQTCYVLALRFDLLPENLRPLAARRLVRDITVKNNNHLSTGFLGVGSLNPTLTQVGYPDVAYKLLNNDTFPSWGYSIKQGATTIWERWDGWTQEKGFQDPGMNSFNHYSLGAVGEWMASTVAGIDLDPAQPAYKHIILRPLPGGGLTYAKATYNSIQGHIVSDWKIEDGTLTYIVEVPANTVATVYVPARTGETVREGDVLAEKATGVSFLRREAEAAVYTIGSGRYVFTARRE